jgi:hypothetical protein
MTDVIVHPNVDIDAIACVVATGLGTKVHFIPAGAKELPKVCPCHNEPMNGFERVLDHSLGEKGRLDSDGTRHAAAIVMPETVEWDPALLSEIDEQDSTGLVRQPAFSLSRILMGVKAYIASLWEAAHPGEEVPTRFIDENSIMAMRPILVGLNVIHRRLVDARARASSIPTVSLGAFKIALPSAGDPPFQVAEVLNKEYGCCAQVYHDGHNLGVFRYPGHSEPDLRKLTEQLPGWFVHTAGFLACWGSKKSPATSAPPAGTPQNAEQLVEAMRMVWGS